MSVHVWRRCPANLRALLAVTAVFAVTAAFGVSAASAATTPDGRSDRTALVAYQRFVSTLLADVPAAGSDADAFVTSVSSGCPDVLAAVALLRATPNTLAVVSAFAEEAEADVLIVTNRASRVPFTALAGSLSKLRWSDARTALAVRTFLAAGRQFLWQSPSPLCADAAAIATSRAQTTPPSTLRTLATFGQLSARMDSATARLATALTRHAGAGNATRVKQIGHLSARLDAALNQQLTDETKKLLIALGVPAE